MEQPTHAVRMIDNWDGEGAVITILAIFENGKFYNYDTNKKLLEYEGDKILKSWELKL